jgi:hypothetical protein
VNRRSVLRMIAGGIVAATAGRLVAPSQPAFTLTDEQRKMLNTDIGNFDHLYPPQPIGFRAVTQPDGSALMTWQRGNERGQYPVKVSYTATKADS